MDTSQKNLKYKKLIDIINTDNEPNIIEGIMAKEKPIQTEAGEWLYKGCYIQESIHPKLSGKYEVFKDNKAHTHIGRYSNFKDALKACKDSQ